MATYTKQPSAKENSYLNQHTPTENNSTGVTVEIYNRSVYAHRPCISFDISDFPGGTISSATLYLYYFSHGTPDPVGKSVDVYKLTRNDWVEAESTWNSYKTGSTWTTAGGDYVTSSPVGGNVNVPASYGWMTVDITAIVNDAIANVSSQVNLIVKFTDETLTSNYSTAIFYSRRWTADTTQCPKLIIDYNASAIKTVNGLAVASVKTVNGLAIASVKTFNGLS